MIHFLKTECLTLCLVKPNLYSHKDHIVDCEKCKLVRRSDINEAISLNEEDVIEIT